MKIMTLPIIILAFLMPLATGLIGQEHWLWFYVSIPLALVVSFILVCLPGIPAKTNGKLAAVENEEIFDHLFIHKTRKTYITLRNGKASKTR
jgi:hypothetical protein